MSTYDHLAESVQRAGHELFWQGPVNEREIDQLAQLIGCELPTSFKDFLTQYGGGGPIGAEVSGIEDGDASKATGGTVLGDTLACRADYALPHGLVVIYWHDGEVCWCLETDGMHAGECAVIAYDICRKKKDREIAKTFDAFMRQHLELYAEAV